MAGDDALGYQLPEEWEHRDVTELGDDAEGHARPTLPMEAPPLFEGAPVIDSYSRAQAVADGALVDVTETAKRWGFLHPVAFTLAFWKSTEVFPLPEAERRAYVLRAVRERVLKATDEENRGGAPLLFGFFLLLDDGPSEVVGGQIHLGPGDSREPVFTIMLNEED